MTSPKFAAFVLCACLLMIGGVFAQEPEPTPTETPTLVPTDTPTNTDTPSPVPTDTTTSTATSTETPTVTAAHTATTVEPEVTAEITAPIVYDEQPAIFELAEPDFSIMNTESLEPWCYTWDFLASNGGFTPIPAGSGNWVSGQGWVGANITLNSVNRTLAQIQKTFTSTTLTRIEFEYYRVEGSINASPVNAIETLGIFINGTARRIQKFRYASTHDIFSWTGTVSGATNIYLESQASWMSSGGTANGSTQLTNATLRGLGTNPFGMSNCDLPPTATPTNTPTETPTNTPTTTPTPTPSVITCPIGDGTGQTLNESHRGEFTTNTLESTCQQIKFNVLEDCLATEIPLGLSAVYLSLNCPSWEERGFNVQSNGPIIFQAVDANTLGNVIAEVSVPCIGINGCYTPMLEFLLQPSPDLSITEPPHWTIYNWSSLENTTLVWKAIAFGDNVTLQFQGGSLSEYEDGYATTQPDFSALTDEELAQLCRQAGGDSNNGACKALQDRCDNNPGSNACMLIDSINTAVALASQCRNGDNNACSTLVALCWAGDTFACQLHVNALLAVQCDSSPDPDNEPACQQLYTQCENGDQHACSMLSESYLQRRCQEGNNSFNAACRELLKRCNNAPNSAASACRARRTCDEQVERSLNNAAHEYCDEYRWTCNASPISGGSDPPSLGRRMLACPAINTNTLRGANCISARQEVVRVCYQNVMDKHHSNLLRNLIDDVFSHCSAAYTRFTCSELGYNQILPEVRVTLTP